MSVLTEESASMTSNECADITVKVAANREERCGAFRLAYQSYLRSGLCDPCDAELRITPYQLLPTTDVIIAQLRGEVISTLSLVRDGELGLPLEEIYADNVGKLRSAGVRLAEVSCLADRRRDFARFFPLFCELARVMIQMSERDRIDQLLIAVHPRHARIYRRAMAFEQIADDRDYPSVNGNPAVLLSLDLARAKITVPATWSAIVGAGLPEAVVRPRPICEVDRFYFEKLAASAADSREAARDLECEASSLICA
jgi:hypothetical protein